MPRIALAGLLFAPAVTLAAADPQVEFFLEDAAARKEVLQRCLQLRVPEAAADKQCQAARSADRKAHVLAKRGG